MTFRRFQLSGKEKRIIERAERHAQEDRAVRKMVDDIPRQRKIQILFHLWANGYKRGKTTIEPYDQFMETTGHYSAIRTLLSDELMRRHIKGRVLDLSCGTGAVLEMLLQSCPGIEFVQANDISSTMLGMAERRIRPLLGKRVVFSRLDLDESIVSNAWPRHEFDVVLLSQTWHLKRIKVLFKGYVAERVLKPMTGKMLWIDEFPAKFSGEKGVIDLFFNSLLTPQLYHDFIDMLHLERIPHIERWTDIDDRHSMYAFLLQPPDPDNERAKEVLLTMAVEVAALLATFAEIKGKKTRDWMKPRNEPTRKKGKKKNDEIEELIKFIHELMRDPQAIITMAIDSKLNHALAAVLGWLPGFTDEALREENVMGLRLKRE